MLENTLALSRQHMSRMIFYDPTIIISITDPGAPEVQIKQAESIREILRLSFHDVDRAVSGQTDIVLFTKEQAQQIIDFVERWNDIVSICAVNCEAGISRSAAVAAAIATIYHLDIINKFFNIPYNPNRFVFRTILNLYYDPERWIEEGEVIQCIHCKKIASYRIGKTCKFCGLSLNAT